jgi:hypothetical protein
MDEPKNERWRELCGQAAVERDPEKLDYLISEILRILEEREGPQFHPHLPASHTPSVV